jgi:uncharacterized protein (DUF983 family)
MMNPSERLTVTLDVLDRSIAAICPDCAQGSKFDGFGHFFIRPALDRGLRYYWSCPAMPLHQLRRRVENGDLDF